MRSPNGSALVAGACATAALTGGTLASNAIGLTRLDLPWMLGTSVTADRRLARAAGWALHAFNGVALARGYRAVWRRAGVAPNARRGALLGLVHGLASLGYMAAAPRVHPRPAVAGLRPFAPTAYGPAWIPAMVFGHMLYGAVFGACVAQEEASAARASADTSDRATTPRAQGGIGRPDVVVTPSARLRAT